jgi:hypothetical protein
VISFGYLAFSNDIRSAYYLSNQPSKNLKIRIWNIKINLKSSSLNIFISLYNRIMYGRDEINSTSD